MAASSARPKVARYNSFSRAEPLHVYRGKASAAYTTIAKREDDHRDRVLQLVDVNAIRAAKLHAFLDANNGAGGPLGVALLTSLNVETICQGGDANGAFLHEPEPTEANLRDVGPLVRGGAVSVSLSIPTPTGWR